MTKRGNPGDLPPGGYREIGELDLLAYADGLLDEDPGRKAAVEEHLRSHPDWAERARVYVAQNEEIRQRYEHRLWEPVPDRLYAALDGNHGAGRGRTARIAASVALLVSVGLAGLMTGIWLDRDTGQPIDEFVKGAVTDHRLSMGTEKYRTVAATGQPLNWLSRHVALEITAPNLSARGYRVVDKRRVTVAGNQPAVRVLYESPEGRRFGLFLRTRWSNAEPVVRLYEDGDLTAATWLDGPLLYSLVGDGRSELSKLADWMVSGRGDEPALPRLNTPPGRPRSVSAGADTGGGADTEASAVPQNPMLPIGTDPVGNEIARP